MMRFDGIEKGALLLAGMFVIFGAYSIINPTEMQLSHPGCGGYHFLIGQDPPAEYLSRASVRIYGAVSVGLGIGIGWIVFYRPRK
jgi:hypothetical protein